VSRSYPFILIVGPTGSGKSAIGLELAKHFNGAILNCDSIQTYQRLDVGSAKPSKEERQQVPHFLFDIVPPREVLTAGDFRRLALETLAEQLRERPVFGVGGSGFYIQALEKGMFDVPKPDPKTDAAVRAECARKSLSEVYQELVNLDPEYAEDISPNDGYRIIRALVIIKDSGRKVSELRREFKPQRFPFPLFKMGLNPSREQLLPRIQSRTEQMLKGGLKAEVEQLIGEGFGDWPALLSVGYREVLKNIRGEIADEDLAWQITEKTMQLAKKQRTWFKRDTEIEWLPLEEIAMKQRALELTRAWVDRQR
jgi:tRNA dimethylallyltransferase